MVAGLLEGGREVRVLSLHPGHPGPGRTTCAIDLRSGAGLDAALDGVQTIVHCATGIRGGDLAAARNLVEAAANAGSPHLVYVSIVGVDRVPLGYYKTKLAVERLIERSTVPWTILRATQFHSLLAGLFAAQRWLPVTVAPAIRFQPIDAGEVAARLVELALGAPAGKVPDMGGPEVREATDLARAWLRVRRRRGKVLPIRLPGATFAAYRSGLHLAPDRAAGTVTFDQFLRREMG